MKRRRGVTLIELSAAMTILSLVWLSVTCVLYALHRADHRLRDDLQSEQSIARLSMRLRLDAHAATSAELADSANGGTELVLATTDERSIHYGDSEAGVYRVVSRGETVVHRDMFLTGRVTSEWELLVGADAALIAVTLTKRGEGSDATRVRRIKAAIAPTRVSVATTAEAR